MVCLMLILGERLMVDWFVITTAPSRAFCIMVDARSSYEAELWALLHGLDLAITLSSHIWVEMGVVAVIALLVSDKHGYAKIRHMMMRIHLQLREVWVHFSHIHREGIHGASGALDRRHDLF